MKVIKLFLVFIFFFSINVFGQFGKNKVHIKDYDWYYIQTKHFDIYFSQEGETLTEFASKAAEDAIASIQSTLNYRVNNRITIIIFNSKNEFQETNVIDQYLSEGIEGFTELFKNRVVIQFTGSYKQFRHLIHHELTHAVMNDMFYGGSIQNIIANNISLQFPLWFSEGLAEYEALGWDVDTDMFIRDAAVSEYLPEINQLSGYFAYRGGQSVFYYIANKYGKEKIGELVNKIKGVGNVEEGIKATLGIDVKELGERWKKDIKKTFWPDVALRDDPEDFAKRLTDPEKDKGFYNTSPTLSPQGDKIAFISNRDYYFGLYIMDALTGKTIERLIEGNQTPDFEELNILTPGLTWSPDGTKIALSAKSSGVDVIYIFDVESEEREVLDINFDAIESVTWSNDGKYLAFIGQNARQSDLYTYNFETKEIINLTNDIFSDSDPSWSHDDKGIYFSSDRGDKLDPKQLPGDFRISQQNYSQKDIYKFDLAQNKIVRITDLPLSDEMSPREEANGENLILISDLNGINNIYIKPISVTSDEDSLINSKIRPITNSLSGLYQLSLSKDTKKLVFSTLYESVFNIFMLDNPFERKMDVDVLEPTIYFTKLEEQRNKKSEIKKLPGEQNQNEITPDDEDEIKIFTGDVIEADTLNKSNGKDFSNFVFGMRDSSQEKVYANDSLFIPKDNLDSNGNYRVNKYKITFGPDLIYANAGYSTFYGLIGTTILSFSDVLGDHRLVGVTGLQVDLKNSDYGLAYYYLGGKIDYGVQGFHTARFVNLVRGNYINLYRYRSYGAYLSASLPLNRFYRFEGGISWLNVRGENLDDLSVPLQQASYIVPSLAFVHDNVMWGYTSPIQGTRYRFEAYGNPGIGDKKLGFYTLSGDYRTYLRFWTDYSFVMRFSGGYSGGTNAQRFFLGGIENWINRSFATSQIPIESTSDYAFLTAVLPLRGYNYSERIGSKYFLMNYELRFPLIRYLVPGPLPILFSNILGVAYIDAGTAWNNTSKLQFFNRNENGSVVSKDLLMGTGVGARVFFLYFLLRFDVAWAYNVDRFAKPIFYFSIGADF
ncbi:MAG TPA: biopolymer transporter Tol [Ignavibacteriales bacterium]|nr:biopolymer transporter Tol [Ignavibacteriales bacterium]